MLANGRIRQSLTALVLLRYLPYFYSYIFLKETLFISEFHWWFVAKIQYTKWSTEWFQPNRIQLYVKIIDDFGNNMNILKKIVQHASRHCTPMPIFPYNLYQYKVSSTKPGPIFYPPPSNWLKLRKLWDLKQVSFSINLSKLIFSLNVW